MDDEISRFKRDVNLIEYAAASGYQLDRRASSAGSKTMRNAHGDKIIVYRSKNDAQRYFSVRDERDNGSVIDFIANRDAKYRSGGNVNLGEIRKHLREYTHSPPPVRLAEADRSLTTIPKDRAAVALEVSRARVVTDHAYLTGKGEGERHLSASILNSKRFAGTWLEQAPNAKAPRLREQNVLFPHHDREGLSGYEQKNRGFTGFAKGGDKGLWVSKAFKGDSRLVIAESAIDAISYHHVHGSDGTRYASFGGGLSPNQPKLIKAAIDRMPAGAEIVAAVDSDKDGIKFADKIGELAAAHPGGVSFRTHTPSHAKDWNDHLRGRWREEVQDRPAPAVAIDLSEKRSPENLKATREKINALPAGTTVELRVAGQPSLRVTIDHSPRGIAAQAKPQRGPSKERAERESQRMSIGKDAAQARELAR